MTGPENNNNPKNTSHTSALIGLSAIGTSALFVTHYLKYSNDLSWAKIFNQSWNPTISDPTFAIINISIGVILLLSVAALIKNYIQAAPVNEEAQWGQHIGDAAPVLIGVSGSILAGTLCFGHHGMHSWDQILNQSWNPTVSDPSIAIINIAMSIVILLSVAAIVLIKETPRYTTPDIHQSSGSANGSNHEANSEPTYIATDLDQPDDERFDWRCE